MVGDETHLWCVVKSACYSGHVGGPDLFAQATEALGPNERDRRGGQQPSQTGHSAKAQEYQKETLKFPNFEVYTIPITR